MIKTICEYRKCDNKFKPLIKGGYKKRFCSFRCNNNHRQLIWRTKHPNKARLNRAKFILKSLTKKERNKLFKEFKCLD